MLPHFARVWRILTVVLAAFVLYCQSVSALSNDFLVVSTRFSPAFLNVEQGDGTDVATVFIQNPPGLSLSGSNALARHPSTGVLYAAVREGFNNHHLVTVDPVSGDTTLIGFMDLFIEGLAFDSAGTLYGMIDSSSGTPDRLFTINTSTGAPTELCDLSDPAVETFIGTIAFNPDNDSLYRLVANDLNGVDTLQRLNVTTCSVVSEAPITINSNYGGMTWSPEDSQFLLATGSAQFLVDPDTGVDTRLTGLSPSVTGLALLPAEGAATPSERCPNTFDGGTRPADVNPCFADPSCYYSVGTLDGPAAANSIEFDTEFPINGDNICNTAITDFLEDHYDSLLQEFAFHDTFSNERSHTHPEYPGYLSATQPTLPTGFPETVTARELIMTGFSGDGPNVVNPHFYFSRYGSERLNLSIEVIGGTGLTGPGGDASDGPRLSPFGSTVLTLDGGGERVHVTHEVPFGFNIGFQADMEFTLTYGGQGADNGFYIDQFGIRAGAGVFPRSLPSGEVESPTETLPFSVFKIGNSTFAEAGQAAVSNEFRRNGIHREQFTYSVIKNPFVQMEQPAMPGVIASGPVEGYDSAKEISIRFRLDRAIEEAWINYSSFGAGAGVIKVDGFEVDTVKPTDEPRQTLFASYVQFLSAGEHTLTFTSEGTRYIDMIELTDRSAQAATARPAPAAPKIAKARLRGRKLRLTLRDKPPFGCAVRLFGGESAESPSSLLFEIAPNKTVRRYKKRLPKRTRRYHVKAAKYCTGMQVTETRVRSLRRKKRRRR